MKTAIQKFSALLLLIGATLSGSTVLAQQSVRTAVQQGNGAFVHKTDKVYCIGNTALGIPGLAPSECINMTQTKFVITPSGNSISVLEGTLPANVPRPAQRVVFNSTYTETAEGPTKGRVYDTVAITEPDGRVTYTGTLKGNDKGNGKGKGKK
ncbi:hypothetical protein F0P96_09910 [Hymenobacter busanensis]|uniref:Uncharacterized protein n=1 Tax=Hymenobacter busanensis TaxID=2607656 RepID=A0A7L5A0V2_9BACT|nr:hypothetical protein [Hymenobacter busanensis]KAA9333281.1 hypothetical protein F0P96_09910 [Hymenobacter busanensis]QHJ08042.1 hypothetical protein GUY19_12410 [Hymenobacter busanensis]